MVTAGRPEREITAGIHQIAADTSYGFVGAARRPVTRLGYDGGLWLITGYHELAAALLDTDAFSSAHTLPGEAG
ncbi:MAG: hypothetical protein ACLQDY_17895 [Streptosporangiaceae bacterium]